MAVLAAESAAVWFLWTSLHVSFTVAGASFEAVGLGLIVAEMRRLRLQELGRESLFRRAKRAVVGQVRSWWRAVRDLWRHRIRKKPRPKTSAVNLGGASSFGGVGTPTLTLQTPPTDPIERLQWQVDNLARGVESVRNALTELADKQGERVDALISDLAELREAMTERRQQDVEATTRLELAGAAFFFLGVVFSMLANLVS